MNIEDLGLSKEQITERLVDVLAEKIINGVDTTFQSDVDERVRERIDAAIEEIAARNVIPNVSTYIENFCFQETSKWGEKKGTSFTFTEYLISRAEAYMREPVDGNGKAKNEDPYSWTQRGTRIEYLISSHLRFHIETAMKEALKNANASIAGGIEEAIKKRLSEILGRLKVSASV